jgi:hypothetical protein
LKQYEAVIQVMERCGGEATLGLLYQEVPHVTGVEWKTRTPEASMRRIVQDMRFFFKIRPGLWALKSHSAAIREKYALTGASKEKEVFEHTYYQGLLLEIGKLKGFDTFVPAQDKNKLFVGNTRLGELASVSEYYDFGYDSMIRRARTVDVTWFNDRKMPHSWYEIEHSTDIQNSLLKFYDLQDYFVKFFIVAREGRRREFESKLAHRALQLMSTRVKFLNYDQVANLHEAESRRAAAEKAMM